MEGRERRRERQKKERRKRMKKNQESEKAKCKKSDKIFSSDRPLIFGAEFQSFREVSEYRSKLMQFVAQEDFAFSAVMTAPSLRSQERLGK
jgi:hypothetical protein